MGNYAYDVVKNSMIINEIAAKEGLELTDEEYNTKVVEYATDYGYEDATAFEEAMGKDIVRDAIQADVVMEFIIDNANIMDAE